MKYILKNGLTVIFQKNLNAQVSALQVWINIGSRDELRAENAEFQDEGGLAHIQEHMLFQGTKTFPFQGQIANLVEAHGGEFNAWTNYDETVYHITMPSKNTELGLKILASMVSEMTCEPDRLKKELEVVMEEFRRCNDDPHNVLQEELFKIAYDLHPYHHPVIGYEKTIKGIDQKTVLNFFNKYYTPSNMTLVVVSNIEETDLKKMLQETFGKIKAKKCPKNIILQEPKQKKPKIVIMQRNFEGTYLSFGYHVTAFKDKDTPVIDLIFTILGNGFDSRLHKKLFEELKLVHSIFADAYTPKDAGFGFIDIELDSDKIKKTLATVFQEIYKLQIEAVSKKELEKAKLQIESQFIYSQETFQDIARNLGQFELIGGGYDKIQKYLENLGKITVKDVKRVAKKYLNKENVTIGLLVPKKEKINITEKEILENINRG